jgi:uncharacterized protein with PQ loop repeat
MSKKESIDTQKDIVNPLPIDWYTGGLTVDNVLKEWEVVINTQMHFNDLIIKYRTAILTVFITLGGALLTIKKTLTIGISESDFFHLCILLAAFWFFAFLIDILYYHQLLIGAVRYALKFDNDETCKKLGLFGMTKTIMKNVTVGWSRFFVSLFYIGPIAAFILAYKLLF